jgi:hypothetical protein
MPARTATRRHLPAAEVRRILNDAYGHQRDLSHGDPNTNGEYNPRGSDDTRLLDALRECLSHCGVFVDPSANWDSLRDAFSRAWQEKQARNGGQKGNGNDTSAASLYDQPLQANSEAVTALSLAGQDANFQKAPLRQRLPSRLTDAEVQRILGPRKGR